MAVAVVYHLADVASTERSPIPPPSWCATRVRINPACVARPDDAAARDAKKRRPGRGEERPARSPDVKRRRRDDARVVSPVTSRKRDTVRHRRDEESPESKRRRRDDARRVSPDGQMKRKREGVEDGPRGSSTSSRSSFGASRPAARGYLHHEARREGARRTTKIHEREREQDTTSTRRSCSGSARSEPRAARPDQCTGRQAQLQMPLAAIARPRAIFMNGRPLQEEYTESFEEAELRRRETQQKREEARREMDKVVQTVFFNDPYISLLDVLKR